MSLKILLVVPIREGTFQSFPDLGILYLGSVLQARDHRVTLIDCTQKGMTFSDFKDVVEQGQYNVVGFRCLSRDHNYVAHHARIVKRINPETLTLVGGPHPSALPEFVISQMEDVDFAWKAEAEEGLPTLLELFGEYGLNMPADQLETVPGLVWKNQDENRIVVNAPSFGIDLDSVNPDWNLLELEGYPAYQKGKTHNTKIWDSFFHINTTRGCPYPCTYCNAPNLSGKRLRHRNPENIISELTFLKERYGAKRFSIIDDEFTLDRKFAVAFSEALVNANLGMRWDCPNGVRMDSIDPELLRLMEAAGCYALCVGIESGNDRVLGLIRKKVTVDTIRERANMIANCSKIAITGYFMIGFLDEREEEIRDTINLALSLPIVRAAFNIVIPIPGTAIFDELIDKGKLKIEEINWDELTNDQIAFERTHISGKRLLQLQRAAFLRFYARREVAMRLISDALVSPGIFLAALRKLRWMAPGRTGTYSFTPMYKRDCVK